MNAPGAVVAPLIAFTTRMPLRRFRSWAADIGDVHRCVAGGGAAPLITRSVGG